MTKQVTDIVLNFKTEVEKFLGPMYEQLDNIYTKDEADTTFAPIDHKYKGNISYGDASSEYHGHVKAVETVGEDTDAVPRVSALIAYSEDKSDALEEKIKNYYGKNDDDNGENSATITDTINQKISKYNIESKLKRFTSAIPYQVPNDYLISEKKINDVIEDITAQELEAAKISDEEGAKNYITPGHYYITPNTNKDDFKIQYGINSESSLYKSYVHGLLDVRRAGNIVIQELYTTSNETYKLTGEKYTRKGTITNENDTTTITWEPWKASYIPYSESDIQIEILGTGINQMVLKETTAGYIIEWNQSGPYKLEANANAQKKIAKFKNDLYISDIPTIFTNHLSGFEIKITKDGIYLTSNKQLGANIEDKHLRRSYFVPRVG